MVWVVSRFRLKVPPGISSSCISPLTSSGQRSRVSWASEPQKSATLSPQPGGKPRRFIRTCGSLGGGGGEVSRVSFGWYLKKKKKEGLWLKMNLAPQAFHTYTCNLSLIIAMLICVSVLPYCVFRLLRKCNLIKSYYSGLRENGNFYVLILLTLVSVNWDADVAQHVRCPLNTELNPICQ